jgi:iron complex outermembrane recepter protein
VNISIKRAVCLCLASASCGATTIAAAADTSTAEGNLGEIVVTAQHREQKESDVGISMTVVTNEQLGALGVTNSRDISNFTPGVFLSGAVGGQSTQYTIRGVGQSDFNDAIESPNATYIDDVYAPVAQASSLGVFDVDRLEVLKGPQGTLFGRNATGGAILTVITQPKLGTTEGYANLSYGLYNETKLEAAFNVPVSSDAAIRVSGYYHYRDNFWDNLYPAGITPGVQYNNYGAPAGVNYETWGPQGLNSGGLHEWGLRGQLLLRPSDQLTARLSVNAGGSRMPGPAQTEVPSTPVFNAAGQVIDEIPTPAGDTRTGIGPGGVNVNPGGFIGFSPSAGGVRPTPGGTWWGPPVGAQDLNFSQTFVSPKNWTKSATATLHLDYQMSGATLTSITAYQHYSKSLMNNVTGDPVNSLYYGTLADYNVFSEELRLAGKNSQLTWQTGAYYLHNSAWNTQDIKGEPGSLWALVNGAPQDRFDLHLRSDGLELCPKADPGDWRSRGVRASELRLQAVHGGE